MPSKLFEFLSSFGLMLLGVFLLFTGSVMTPPLYRQLANSLPVSGVRAQLGGDLQAAALPVSRPVIPLSKDRARYDRALTAVSALVVDDKTDAILFRKNQDQTRSLASLTKLMSALVLLDLPLPWASSTAVSAEDWDGSSHHLEVGEEFTVEDLWNIALVGSSNSAINMLVRMSGVTTTEFVRLLNKKAETLSLDSLKFVDATGLGSGNVGRAEDIGRLLQLALARPEILRAVQQAEYYATPLGQEKLRRIWSTDWLLTGWIPSRFSHAQIAGKTGYTADSNYNFAVRLSDDRGHVLRAIILGAESNEARFTEARDLVDWVLEHYLWPGEPGYEQLAE